MRIFSAILVIVIFCLALYAQSHARRDPPAGYVEALVYAPDGWVAFQTELKQNLAPWLRNHCDSQQECREVIGNILNLERVGKIAHMRIAVGYFQQLNDFTWNSIQVLALARPGEDVYEILQQTPVKFNGYKQIVKFDDTVPDPNWVWSEEQQTQQMIPNPQNVPTIIIDDGEGGTVEIANPAYEPFRKITQWQ